MPEPRMIDPRQPRLGQGITGLALLVGYLLDVPTVLPVLAAVLALASLGGPAVNPYAWLFRALRPALGRPRELEEAAPPRFANTVGFVFLTAASLAAYVLDTMWLAWTLGLIVSALALLAAVTGLCVGCELYVYARRVLTRGRVSERLTRPVERAA